MTLVVKIIFLVVAWAFWAVLGTLFWCALVVRALTVFSATFLYAMLTEQAPAPVHARVEDVTDLWFRGFRNAYLSLFGNLRYSPIEVRNTRLVLELL